MREYVGYSDIVIKNVMRLVKNFFKIRPTSFCLEGLYQDTEPYGIASFKTHGN